MHRLWMICAVLIAGGVARAQTACENLRLPVNRVVGMEQSGDVTGDGATDVVFILGTPEEPGAGFSRTHDLLILEGRTGRQTVFPLGAESGGYPASLFLGDFNGDGVADILAGIATGGSGGVTNYYLLTARGGQPSYLIQPQVLTTGPRWTVTLQENFRAAVVNADLNRSFTLDLRQNYRNDPQVYRDVYASTGRLLKPTTGEVDPYGFIEPVRQGAGAPYALVGYQSIWLLFHANTVGTARSVWRWTGNRMALTNVQVMLLYAPANYTAALAKLNTAQPGTAAPQAVALYRTNLAQAPPVWRDEAFRNFRTFHQGILDRTNRNFQAQVDAIQRRYAQTRRGNPYQEITQLVARFNASQANRNAGMEAINEGEGYFQIGPRRNFYMTNFGMYLSPAYRDYIALEDVEIHLPIALDAGLVVSLTEVGRRVSSWENYLLNYPDSPFRSSAFEYYTNALNIFLYGVNNTPHFDYNTGRMRAGVAQVMRTYVQTHAGMPSAALVNRMLTLYTQNQFMMSDRLRAAITQVQQAQDTTRAVNYFPLTPGSVWVYPTGGFENAGSRVEVQYRQGNRAQVRTQDTGAQTVRIYEYRDDSVVLVYQAEGGDAAANRLNQPNNTEQIMLRGPVRAGVTWQSGDTRYVIRQVALTRRVLGQPYLNVIEVVRSPLTATDANRYEIHDFYALGVGLIESRYQAAGVNTQTLLCSYRPAG